MSQPKFCVQCGAAIAGIARRRWRVWRGQFCERCSARYERRRTMRIAAIGISVFSIGFLASRCLRSSPPPLTIERRADSPLSDLPVDPTDRPGKPRADSRTGESDSRDTSRVAAATDDAIYICGARTQKGTPCRRRVHAAGERCYQHKGKPAMLPLEKLKVEGGR